MTEPSFTDEITVKLVDTYAADAMVVSAARVSVLGEATVGVDYSENLGLIKFLMRNRRQSR